ncbi:MAG: hypothetical protein ABI208_00380 [Ginsengibacter sp.]|jgi:hypothetical protein
MKNYKVIGIIACTLLVISCFLPWTHYADLNKSFTGFFTEQNIYGKPGKVFIFLAICSALLIVLDKIWAKRTLLFVTAINVAYLIRTYVLFTTCYDTICPQKEYGFFVLMLSVVMLIAVSLFPDMKVIVSKEEDLLK